MRTSASSPAKLQLRRRSVRQSVRRRIPRPFRSGRLWCSHLSRKRPWILVAAIGHSRFRMLRSRCHFQPGHSGTIRWEPPRKALFPASRNLIGNRLPQENRDVTPRCRNASIGKSCRFRTCKFQIGTIALTSTTEFVSSEQLVLASAAFRLLSVPHHTGSTGSPP